MVTQLHPILVLWIAALWISLSSSLFGQFGFEETPHWNANRNDNFFQYGELKELDERGHPIGWECVAAFESGHGVALPDAKGIIQLTCPPRAAETSITATIDLPDGIKFVTILTRMRGPTVTPGEASDAGAGMIYSFVRGDRTLRDLPRVEPIYRYGSLGGWKTYRSTARVLPGEKKLVVRASIVDAKGAFEVDRVLVLASQPGYDASEDQINRLRRAIAEDDATAIENLIEETPELLEFRNGQMENGTPLILASSYNSHHVVKKLADMGADLEASDESWGNTPLAWCCWWGNADVAEVLVAAGAETKHFATMAESSKSSNPRPRGTIEDFDRIIQCIEDAKKNAASSEATTTPSHR